MDKSSNADDFWHKKTFAIVTGASRGIGRTLAQLMAKKLAAGSVLLMISRDESELDSLQKSITSEQPSIRVHVGVADLSSCSEFALKEMLSAAQGNSIESFSHAICIHNAGSLGDATKRCTDLLQIAPCVNYFHLNVVSVMVLNAIFLNRFAHVKRKTIVNMSSLCGVEPFASLSLYCTGKAARDMFFQVLAKEEKDVRVLNYAPGPVETKMRNQLLDESWMEEIKSGDALTTEMTCDRLLRLLATDSYISGAHIDYYDP